MLQVVMEAEKLGTNNAKSNSTDLTTSRAGCGDGGNGATNGGQAGTSAIANLAWWWWRRLFTR